MGRRRRRRRRRGRGVVLRDERVGRDGTRDSRRSRGVLGLQPTIRRVWEIRGSQRRTRRHSRADGDQMERFFELVDESEGPLVRATQIVFIVAVWYFFA